MTLPTNCCRGALPLRHIRRSKPRGWSYPESVSLNRRQTELIRATAISSTSAPLSSTRLVDAMAAPDDYDDSAVVYEDFVSEEESQALVSDLSARLKRRRYERGHWDSVIVKYKETELYDEPSLLSELSRAVLNRIRRHITEYHYEPPASQIRWLPCHVIDYHADGKLSPHVDSVRFSGKTVSGLSLLSPAIMRLRPAPKEESDSSNHGSSSYHVTYQLDPEAGFVDLLLPPRSLYVLSNGSRYRYTHELLPAESKFKGMPVLRSHRMSVIFRDALD